MPTARWDRPHQLFGYLEEEERVALEPLLGTELYDFLCEEYTRLKKEYGDVTSVTITPTREVHKHHEDDDDVTAQLDAIHAQEANHQHHPHHHDEDSSDEVSEDDYQTVRLIRICQQIEFYKMLSHKAGLLTVSFNEGGGMNMISADGYDPADDKRMERVVKDAFMSAGRSVDSLLLFLEADAKGKKLFTEKWKNADAFYLQKDLLFQTARVLQKYLDIKSERMAYISLVHDIRFCQNTYLKPRIGKTLLDKVVEFANNGDAKNQDASDSSSSEADGNSDSSLFTLHSSLFDELLVLLRTALAFYVESRRTTLGPKEEKFARRDSMTDAQQAMAAACQFVEENIRELGDIAKDSPIYKKAQEQERQHACTAAARSKRAACGQPHSGGSLFTAFPATHRNPELK